MFYLKVTKIARLLHRMPNIEGGGIIEFGPLLQFQSSV